MWTMSWVRVTVVRIAIQVGFPTAMFLSRTPDVIFFPSNRSQPLSLTHSSNDIRARVYVVWFALYSVVVGAFTMGLALALHWCIPIVLRLRDRLRLAAILVESRSRFVVTFTIVNEIFVFSFSRCLFFIVCFWTSS